MTTNPLWQEITRELMPGQQAGDRPDLISRVFNLKLAKLLNEITVRMCFGVVIAHVHVIEWQKRGLPHVHLLIWLRDDCKIRTNDDIDTVVSAQIPDPEVSIHPDVDILHTTITDSSTPSCHCQTVYGPRPMWPGLPSPTSGMYHARQTQVQGLLPV